MRYKIKGQGLRHFKANPVLKIEATVWIHVIDYKIRDHFDPRPPHFYSPKNAYWAILWKCIYNIYNPTLRPVKFNTRFKKSGFKGLKNFLTICLKSFYGRLLQNCVKSFYLFCKLYDLTEYLRESLMIFFFFLRLELQIYNASKNANSCGFFGHVI